jgi:pyruvate,water dikinase
MIRHGHHTRGEIELFNARWSETGDYVLSIIRTYISSINQINPVESHKKLIQRREELAEQCRRKLGNPVKRRIFSHFLYKAQQGFILRENCKSEIVRHLAGLRKILLALGQKLNGRGVIENQDDIFFLRLEEIEPVIQGKTDFDVKQIIAARHIEYEKNISITPPKVVIGKFDPDNFISDTVDVDSKTLKGLGVSPGVVTGKAHIILRTDNSEHISAGEILVAPFTDPGWTPYFIPAAGIVMDMGGMLSHGSIVAREYGIPAVVNAGDATKIIKTGQMIQVDADKGIVRILD